MRWQTIALSLGTLSLLVGFQNCSAPVEMESENVARTPAYKLMSGVYRVSDFIATSGCPDVENSHEFSCSAVYTEDTAVFVQTLEFFENGSLLIKGACNIYEAVYSAEGLEGVSHFSISHLDGTKNPCDADRTEEESLLVHRLLNAVRMVSSGSTEISIYTDQSSAIRLLKL